MAPMAHKHLAATASRLSALEGFRTVRFNASRNAANTPHGDTEVMPRKTTARKILSVRLRVSVPPRCLLPIHPVHPIHSCCLSFHSSCSSCCFSSERRPHIAGGILSAPKGLREGA